jgi:hypothetical protein
MPKSRTPGIILLLAGGALIVAGAVAYSLTSRKTAVTSRELARVDADLDSTRAELRKTSLRYQGFAKGMPELPDSVRRYEAGATFRQSQVYDKMIYSLEIRERDLKLEIIRLTKKQAAAARRARAISAPLAGGGALAVLAGLLVLARSRARPVAP